MPRTNMAVNNLSRAAATAVPAEVTADVVNGNDYVNSPTTFMTVRNAHATLARNVTVTMSTTLDGVTATATKVYAIPATVTQELGLFPAETYGDRVAVDGETTDIKFVVRRLK